MALFLKYDMKQKEKLCTLGLSVSSTIFHVKMLEEAGLITRKSLPNTRGNQKLCTCVTGFCGLATPTGRVGIWDSQSSFFFPERFHAGLLWSSSGYVEYKVGNGVPASRTAKQLSLSMEICSEAPQHDNKWKSDITLWVNNIECATWTRPGDFGDRRGRLTPRWWSNVDTQYGMLIVWKINEEGTFMNEKKYPTLR